MTGLRYVDWIEMDLSYLRRVQATDLRKWLNAEVPHGEPFSAISFEFLFWPHPENLVEAFLKRYGQVCLMLKEISRTISCIMPILDGKFHVWASIFISCLWSDIFMLNLNQKTPNFSSISQTNSQCQYFFVGRKLIDACGINSTNSSKFWLIYHKRDQGYEKHDR